MWRVYSFQKASFADKFFYSDVTRILFQDLSFFQCGIDIYMFSVIQAKAGIQLCKQLQSLRTPVDPCDHY